MEIRKWIKVSSSRISKVSYDLDNEKVYVKFKNGGKVYIYEEVSEKTFEMFINAPSIGKAIPSLGSKYRRAEEDEIEEDQLENEFNEGLEE